MRARLDFVVLLLAFLIVLQPDFISPSRFKFTNFVCDSVDESVLLVHTCRLKAVRRDKTTLNFNGTLLKSINKCRVHAQIFKRANGFKPWLYNITIEACRFLRKPYEAPVILVFNLFKSFSVFNKTCPYEGSVYVMGFYLMAEQIPVPLPSGEYLILIKWYVKDLMMISTGIYFSFEENLT
ncbi:uncharacterized protein [Drosophila kikkawai]|uniref:MD-2-related lipid-recognition domain-containing protein n=1 Tax=Drosophila kikkawai TaxID=30033 RepID=A0A6P4IQ71_DROKI